MIQYEAMWEKICADIINSPNKDIIFNYIRDDGYKTESNMKFWFSGTVNKEERKILNMLEGKVLDLACGFGRHLRCFKDNRNVETCIGVEISQVVTDFNLLNNIPCVCSDMVSFLTETKERFDSILIMGNSIAEYGSIEAIKSAISNMVDILNDGGKLVISYKDVSEATDLIHKGYQEKNKNAGKYEGVVKIKLEYHDKISENKQLCYIKKEDWSNILKHDSMQTVYEAFFENWHYIVLEKRGK